MSSTKGPHLTHIKALLKVLRENGVTRYRDGNIELDLSSDESFETATPDEKPETISRGEGWTL